MDADARTDPIRQRGRLILGGMFLLNLLAAALGTSSVLAVLFVCDLDSCAWLDAKSNPLALALQVISNFAATYFFGLGCAFACAC